MKKKFKSTSFKVFSAIAIVLLLIMIVSAITGKISPISTIFGTIVSPFQKGATWVSDKINIAQKNSYEDEIVGLEKEIELLQSQIIDYETLKQQNEQYKQYLELKDENSDFLFVDAQIIGKDKIDNFYAFTISKGSIDGIEVNDPVISGKYVVGRISQVGPTYAKVKTILSPEVNVSAVEVRSRETGVVGGSVELARLNLCRMSYLSRNTAISTGTIICTSGIGGTYPDGLIIGTVEEVKNEDRDISAYAVVKSEIDFENLQDVFVITDFMGQGIDEQINFNSTQNSEDGE